MTSTSNSHNAAHTKTNTITTSINIDKLTLVHDLPNQWKEELYTSMKTLFNDLAYLGSYGISRSYAGGGYKASFACRVPISENPLIWSQKVAFLFQVESKAPGKPPLRLDINPEGLTPTGLRWIDRVMREVFDICWATWIHSSVTRVDAAIDASGVAVEDWIWDMPVRKVRSLHVGKDGIETLYLGAKNAGNPVVVYDKAKQAKMGPDSVVTRVEFRNRTKRPISSIAKMPNPLQGLKVIDMKKFTHPFPGPVSEALKCVGNAKGLAAISALFEGATAKSVKNAISMADSKWWSDCNGWEMWPAVVDETLAGLFPPHTGDADLLSAYKSLMTGASSSDVYNGAALSLAE